MAFQLEAVYRFVDKSKSGTSSASKGLDDLTKAAKSVGLALGVAFGANMVADVAKAGAQFERVNQTFEALVRGKTTESVEDMFDAFQKGAGGVADKMTVVSSASKLMQMNLANDATTMEKVVELATRLGDQTASVANRTSDFALMLANQSIPRLDNFGISSGRVRARIEELQSATEGMTREAAFMQAVMEEGGDALAILGPRAEDSALAFEKTEAKMADLRLEVGMKLAPVMAELMDVLSGLLDIALPLVDVIGNLVGKVADAVGGLLSLAGIDFGNLLDLQKAAETAETLGKLGDAAGMAEETSAGWVEEMRNLQAEGKSTEEIVMLLRDRIYQASQAMEDGGIIADIFVDQTGLMGETAQDLHDVILDQTGTWEEYIKLIDWYNSMLPDSAAGIAAMTEAQWDAAAAAEEQARWIGKTIDITEDFTQTNADYVNAQNNATGATNASARAARNSRRARMEEAGAFGAGGRSAQEMRQAQAALAAETENAIRVAEHQKLVAESQAEALAKTQAAAAEAARAQGELAVELTGATEEMFKQQIFEMIDPAAIGMEAYGAIGVELGILDEKSVNLAVAAEAAAEAINAGAISAEDAAPMMTALWEEAGKVTPEFEDIIEKAADMPEKLDFVKERSQALFEEMINLGDGALIVADNNVILQRHVENVGIAMDNAAPAVEDLGKAADVTGAKAGDAVGPVQDLGDAAEEAAGDYYMDIHIRTHGDIPEIPSFQHGGIVPGTPGGRGILAVVHPGEVINNPAHSGLASARRGGGAPGGGGGDNYVVHINDRAAAAWWQDQQRRKRYSMFTRRVRGN